MKERSESDCHYRLKKAALTWLYNRGARSIGFEVSIRTPKFVRMRIDVAAHDRRFIFQHHRGPRGGWRREKTGEVDEWIAIECKSSRGDFLKDSHKQAELIASLARLEDERIELEAELRREEPHLCIREHLFPDDPVWRFDRSADPRYAELLRKTEKAARRLHDGTKFENLRGSRLFHRHYVCASPGVVKPSELPPGWGLLEEQPESATVGLIREAESVAPDTAAQADILERIARAGTRALLNATGMALGEQGLEPVAPGENEEE